MTSQKRVASWTGLALFYGVLIVIVMIVDQSNGLLRLSYVLAQLGLITVGVGVFAIVGWRVPDVQAETTVLLAFTVGILTIIPALLMSWGQVTDFWQQYFLVAFGMAAGSLMSFWFVRIARRKKRWRGNSSDKESK